MPNFAMIRFSLRSGTMSAIVPNATRSRYLKRFGSLRSPQNPLSLNRTLRAMMR